VVGCGVSFGRAALVIDQRCVRLVHPAAQPLVEVRQGRFGAIKPKDSGDGVLARLDIYWCVRMLKLGCAPRNPRDIAWQCGVETYHALYSAKNGVLSDRGFQ
jgi:hypothetical protein